MCVVRVKVSVSGSDDVRLWLVSVVRGMVSVNGSDVLCVWLGLRLRLVLVGLMIFCVCG